jgi:hypothetical protein
MSFQANGILKQAEVAITKSDRIDIESKYIRSDKEGHNINIKGSIHQESVTIINLYASIIRAHNFIKQNYRSKGRDMV